MTRATFCFLILVTGCGRPAAAPPPDDAVTVTDAMGETVTVVGRPGRIVSLSPAATEALFAIGAGPRVVAVTTADTYPPEAKKLPTVGGFGPATISAEAVLAQRPDLVIAAKFHESTARTLRQAGLTVITLEPRSLEQVIANVEMLGKVTREADGAKAVVDDFRQRLERVRERAAKATQRPKVLYVLWDDPLQTAGPKSFIGQLITEAGGVNLFAEAAQDYPRVSDEAVLAGRPDVLIAPGHGGADVTGRLGKRTGWDRLPAVRTGRVHTVPEDLINRPGPRLIDGLEALQKVLSEAPR